MKKYNLKKIRQEKGYTQADIAKILETTPQQYYRYETEKRELSANQIKKLCEFYKVSANYLLDIKNTTEDYEIYEKKCSHIFVQYAQKNNEIKR